MRIDQLDLPDCGQHNQYDSCPEREMRPLFFERRTILKSEMQLGGCSHEGDEDVICILLSIVDT